MINEKKKGKKIEEGESSPVKAANAFTGFLHIEVRANIPLL